jgi:cytochrome P450
MTASGVASWPSARRTGLDALPGPAATPLLGWRGNLARFYLDPIGYLDELSRHGNLVLFARGMRGGCFQVGNADVPGTVLAYGPSVMQTCLNTGHAGFRSFHLPRPPGRSFSRLLWGLQWLHEEKHRQQRRMIMPAFHHKRLSSYRDMLVAITDRAVSRWAPGDMIDVVEEVKQILLTFGDRAFLGLGEAKSALSLGEEIHALFRYYISLSSRLPLDLPFTPQRRERQRAERLCHAFDALIAERRASGARGDDILSMLLDARDEDGVGMTQDELIGELAFLVIAGFESSIYAMAFTMYLIAQHPEVAASLHDELTAALRGDAPTLDQLNGLPLLDGVVKESLRLLSPVPFIMRSVEAPVELEGHHLPAGTELVMSFHHLHRMPELYPEPRRFLPERWRTLKPGASEYIPFSVGPHICAGWALAMMELKLLVAMFVQRFRLDLPRGARIDRLQRATLRPMQGMWMRVQPQDRRFRESRTRIRGSLATMIDLGA